MPFIGFLLWFRYIQFQLFTGLDIDAQNVKICQIYPTDIMFSGFIIQA